jgi:hypothetical protein
MAKKPIKSDVNVYISKKAKKMQNKNVFSSKSVYNLSLM